MKSYKEKDGEGKKRGVSMERSKEATKKSSPDCFVLLNHFFSLTNQNIIIINLIW